MNETVCYAKERNQLGIENGRFGESGGNSLWKYPMHMSLKKEGKILNGLSTTLFTKPQKFLEICVSLLSVEMEEEADWGLTYLGFRNFLGLPTLVV